MGDMRDETHNPALQPEREGVFVPVALMYDEAALLALAKEFRAFEALKASILQDAGGVPSPRAPASASGTCVQPATARGRTARESTTRGA